MRRLPAAYTVDSMLKFAPLLCILTSAAAFCQAVNYDIVYVRAPRYGDTTDTKWPEVFDPIKMEGCCETF